MKSNFGIDPMRGRPTPGVASTEEKIQRRKLDSLRRGIHRINEESCIPYSIHLVGIGEAGTSVVAQALSKLTDRTLDAESSRVSVFAVDIGCSSGLQAVRAQQSRICSKHAHFEILQLDRTDAAKLQDTLARYPDFLRLEYPLYQGASYTPWLDEHELSAVGNEHLPRAVAKAVYGRAYYDGERPAEGAVRRFAKSVAETPGESLVCVCFGLGGGTGSGIVVDLARHISNVRFGRRVLMVGIGIAPCDGDGDAASNGHVYSVLNELDCMGDELKNQGVVSACGDLYKNPFTAGFLLVPQEHIWETTKDLTATHERVDEEVATFITQRNGVNLWEALRLLNWVAAPSTQHSAARTPYGSRWIHMLAFADSDGKQCPIGNDLPRRLGLRPTYKPEFIEARVVGTEDATRKEISNELNAAFRPVIEPQVTVGGGTTSVHILLPQLCKTDLELFARARAAYDGQPFAQKVLGHSWLLERALALCEPSKAYVGMAGASLDDGGSWVGVPYDSLRGVDARELSVPERAA